GAWWSSWSVSGCRYQSDMISICAEKLREDQIPSSSTIPHKGANADAAFRPQRSAVTEAKAPGLFVIAPQVGLLRKLRYVSVSTAQCLSWARFMSHLPFTLTRV